MPPYVTAPGGNAPVKLLLIGDPAYALGSLDGNSPTTKMSISNVSLTGNVATLTVSVRFGNIPAVGGLITVKGVASTGGIFNVTNAVLTAVSIVASTGIGTVSFALTHADVVSAPSAGTAYVPVAEVGETLSNGTSQQFALPDVTGMNQNGRTLTWQTTIAGAPATVTATLQGSLVDVDSQYQDIDSSTSTTGELRYVTLINVRFVRLVISNVSGGTAPTIVGKLAI